MARSIRLPLPTILLLGAALGAVLMTFGAASVAAQARFAELRVLAGQAEVQRKSETFLLAQGQRMTLRHTDLIRTLAEGKVHLRLVQSSAEAIITADTRIRAGDLTRDGRPRDLLTVLYGGLRLRVKRWLGKEHPVQAGVATIGIKGTDFVTLVKRKQGGEYMSDENGAGGDGAGTDESDALQSIPVTEFIGIEGTIEAVNRRHPAYRLTIGHRQWGQMLPDEPPAPPIRVPDDVWITTLETFSFLP
jgi:hypothetical protein